MHNAHCTMYMIEVMKGLMAPTRMDPNKLFWWVNIGHWTVEHPSYCLVPYYLTSKSVNVSVYTCDSHSIPGCFDWRTRAPRVGSMVVPENQWKQAIYGDNQYNSIIYIRWLHNTYFSTLSNAPTLYFPPTTTTISVAPGFLFLARAFSSSTEMFLFAKLK